MVWKRAVTMECFQAFGFHGMVTPLTDRVSLIMVSIASKYRWRHFYLMKSSFHA